MEGRPSGSFGRTELFHLTTRLIIEEGLEAEVRDALDRGYYEHGTRPGGGYCNGLREGRLKTAEGFIDYAAPQVAGTAEPFRSELRQHLKGHSEALESLAIEMLARGISVRDIEDAFKDESGRLLLSKTAVSELGERLWADYRQFATRDLSEHHIVYLFVDGIAARIWPGQRREPVPAVGVDTARARAAYEEAFRLQPKDFWTCVELARLRRTAGDLAASRQAAESAERAARTDRERSVADDELGEVLVKVRISPPPRRVSRRAWT